jgi:hypothetical protein
MRAFRTFILFIGLPLATGALAGVSVDYDESVDFSKYATYGWLEGTPAQNPLVQKRIVAAVEREIEAKGLAKATGAPDLLLATHASATSEKRIDVDDYGYSSRGPGWGTTTMSVRDIAVGTLMVDLIDADSKELVWRSIATQTLGGNLDADKIDKRINKMTAKMFKKFPPKSKK